MIYQNPREVAKRSGIYIYIYIKGERQPGYNERQKASAASNVGNYSILPIKSQGPPLYEATKQVSPDVRGWRPYCNERWNHVLPLHEISSRGNDRYYPIIPRAVDNSLTVSFPSVRSQPSNRRDNFLLPFFPLCSCNTGVSRRTREDEKNGRTNTCTKRVVKTRRNRGKENRF